MWGSPDGAGLDVVLCFRGRRDSSTHASSATPPQPPIHAPGTPSALEILPIEALYRIADLSLDVSALTCSCRLFRAICAEVCSDLLPTLHSHQRAAARCMMAREAPPKPLPHPFIRQLPLTGAGDGLYVYADTASGHLSIEPPPTVHDVRGGLFCDEPGLGKTVTALGVILKTVGVEPSPPVATEVRRGVASDPDGFRPVCGSFYMARVDSLVAAARDGVSGVEAAAAGDDAPAEDAGARSTGSARRSRKERAAVETPRLMLSARNRNLLEDLDLIPRVGGRGEVDAAEGAASGVEPGFVSEADAFVGCAARNVEHFRAVFLQFCIANNLTPYALSEMPVLRHLLDRLRPRGTVKAPGASAAAAAPPQRGGRRRQHRAAPSPGPPPTAVTICRPHVTARVTVLRRELGNWMKTVPTERPVKRPRNTTPAAAATAAAAAATEAGMRHAEALLTTLGFVPAAPPAAAVKRSALTDDDPEWDAPAPSPNKSRAGNTAGPSPIYVLPEPLRSSPGLRLDVPALEEGLNQTSDAYALVAAHEPVPLSPATLIVVPGILVDHWRHEIAKHVRPGALRVCYLESARDADVPAHRLAWDYDVVLTTFSHLSSHGGAAALRDRNLRHAVLQVRPRHLWPLHLHAACLCST